MKEVAQTVELFLGLAGEAGDDGGAQGDIGHTLPNVGDEIPEVRFISRAVHPAENCLIAVLDGHIQIGYHVRLFRHNVQQLLGDALRIAVEHPHPADAVDVAKLPQQLRQTALAVQVAAVACGVLCDDHQFGDVVFRQPVRFLQHLLHGNAAVRTTDGRDGTVAAPVAASLGDLQVGEKRQRGDNAVPVVSAFSFLPKRTTRSPAST